MQINELERKIITGAVKAQRDYLSMSVGWWIDHAPESFLQIVVAQQLAKLGHAVYIDASIQKVKLDLRVRGAGRPAKNSRQRADISVWNKSDDSLRAAIEVKRAWNIGPIRRDAEKLEKYLSQKGAAKVGYLLAYSDAKGKGRRGVVKERFRHWAKELSWELRVVRVHSPHDDEWAWGFGLIRSVLD